ncbi:MAG: hypothetical protein IJT16_01855 [Lachnospiraceae bacterium]|nr:hypothetical protein [Lachnospiraceae bacterium]
MDLKRNRSPFYRMLSIFLVVALIVEILPPIRVFAEASEGLYGGSVSFQGVTARVISDHQDGTYHYLTLSGEREEGSPEYLSSYCYLLYSPSEKCFSTGSDGKPNYCELYENEEYGGYRGSLSFREETGENGGLISDWELFCIRVGDPQTPSHGGIRAFFGSSALGSIIRGELPLSIVGNQEVAGVHAFYPAGSFAVTGERESVSVNGAGGEYHGDPVSLFFTLPDMKERAYDIRLLHAFWGSDRSLCVSGAGEGERYFAAAYDEEGRLLEVKELTDKEDDETGPVPSSSTVIEKREEAAEIKLIGLDRNFAPLSYDLTKPEADPIEEASVGTPGEAGSASVSIAGTDSSGELLLESANKPVPYENTRTIAMVDASMQGGELSGVAELRIKYQSDSVSGETYSPSELLPGYYNPETGEWETPVYYIEEDTHEVVILTDHFSTFGLFEIEGGGK